MHARASDNPLPNNGPALILVHGLVVSSRYMAPIAEALSAHYRVYVPDLPGFGKSGKPPHVLSLVELSDTLAAWMQEAGLERAAFLGNSFGCQIIADLAVRHPGRVERAVLQGPTMDPRGRTVLRQIGGFLLDMPREPPPSSRSSCLTTCPLVRSGRGAPSGTPSRIGSKPSSRICACLPSWCVARGTASYRSVGRRR